VRRRLVLVVLATTGLVVVAFALPLGALVRSVARDRAVAAAERDAASLAPVLALDTSPAAVTAAVASTGTGADGRLAVWLPDGTAVGDDTPPDRAAVALARGQGRAFAREHDGGLDLYTPVVTGSGATSVVRARVPAGLLDDGVRTAWLALAGVALVLVAAAVVIADRLARSVTRDATELSATARALAAGRADARADPGPTPELADAARALNLWPTASTSCGPPSASGWWTCPTGCGPRSPPCGSTPPPPPPPRWWPASSAWRRRCPI
jgi:hypothetical protein